MIDGAERQENPRGRIMRERVLELWDSRALSTFEIAQMLRMHEATICRIINDRRLGR